MAIDTDMAFELADLNRKLATARALLSYEQKCAETRLLEAAEEKRLLRVRLLHLEPEYNLLLADFKNHSQYATELEEALEATNKRLAWTENSAAKYNARSKDFEGKLKDSMVRNKELEEKLQNKLLSEGAAQGILTTELEEMKSKYATIEQENTELKVALKATEKDSKAAVELGELKNECSKLRQTNNTLNDKLQTQKKEIESANQEYKESQDRIAEMEKSHATKISELKAAIKSIKNETKEETTKLREEAEILKEELTTRHEASEPLKAEVATLKEKLQDHVDRLAKALTTKAASEAALESELATLRLELDDAHSTVKRAAEEAARTAKKEAASERQLLEKELSTLRLELEDAQKTAERLQGTKDPKASKAELTTLTASLKRETKLREKAEKDLARITETNQSLETKLESARAKITTLKSAGAKVPLKEDNSKKRSIPLTMEDLEHSAKRVRKEGPKTSEFSITPFLKKQAAVTTDSPATPSAEPRGVSVDPEDDTAERSIMVPAVVESKEPTRLLLAGAARKRKTAKADPIPEEEPEGVVTEPASPDPELVPSRPKAKPRGGKKPPALPEKVKAQPSIFDSPSSIPMPVAKPKARKKKAPVVEEAGRGIRPTMFDEDDGTGRLVMNNGDPQEVTAAEGRKIGKKGLGKDDGLLLVPVVSAFNKDISPAKKRPAALKKIFVGGKK